MRSINRALNYDFILKKALFSLKITFCFYVTLCPTLFSRLSSPSPFSACAPSPSGLRSCPKIRHVKCSEMYLNINRNHSQQKPLRRKELHVQVSRWNRPSRDLFMPDFNFNWSITPTLNSEMYFGCEMSRKRPFPVVKLVSYNFKRTLGWPWFSVIKIDIQYQIYHIEISKNIATSKIVKRARLS